MTYFNDHVIRHTHLVGSSMPTGIYGGLVLFILLLNQAIACLGKRWAFTGPELAVVPTLTLAACCIPGAGLMETFPDTLIRPRHHARTDPEWQENRAIGMAPERMLADVSGDEDTALNGYVQGMSTGRGHVPASDVPWSTWVGTLGLWLPLIMLLWIAPVGLSVVVHRQWIRHERLPYPIAMFTDALLPSRDDAKRSPFRERPFWCGCGTVLAIHLVNYGCVWWPDRLVQIPRYFSFTSLAPLFPTLVRGGGWWLLEPTICFTVVTLAFFVPTEVSFSLGIGPFLYFYVAGILDGYGVPMGGGDTIYRRLKPLMFGLIAGDMLAGIGTSIIGGIFYLVTGAAPPQFAVLVG